jgi:hypothetical protein
MKRPYNKFYGFIEDVLKGRIDVTEDALFVLLTNTSPDPSDVRVDTTTSPCTLGTTSNAVEIPAGNGYTKKGAAVAVISASQNAGVFTLSGDDLVWAAAEGEVGPFRYFVLFDDTAGTPSARPVIAWWDRGEAITLKDGETFTAELTDLLKAA